MDKITKESEDLEGVIKYLEYSSDICPYCGGGNIGVKKSPSHNNKIHLPRRRICYDCKRTYITGEFVLKLEG